MGYTYFAEVAEARKATQDNRYQKQLTRQWLVRTDSASLGAVYAASHPSLPSQWALHPEDSLAYLTQLTSEQDQNDPLLWRVTAEYSYYTDTAGQLATGNPAVDTQQAGQDPADREASPLLRPRDYTVSTATRAWAIWQGWDTGTSTFTKPIVNSAGDPFLPPVEVEKPAAIVSIGLNSATPPTVAWLNAVGSLNANSMVIGPYTVSAAQAKLTNVSAQRVYENGAAYWRWTVNFELRDNWEYKIMDAGRRELYTAPTTHKRAIIDPVSGQAVSQPVPLSAGKVTTGSPVYLTFHIYPRYTFPTPM